MATETTGDSSNSVRWLLQEYAGPYTGWLSIGLGMTAAGRFAQRLSTVVVGVAIDAILLDTGPFRLPVVPDVWLPTDTGQQVALVVFLLAASYAGEAVAGYASTRLIGRVGQYVQHDVRTDVFDTVQRLEMGFFDETDTGEVMSVLNDDVEELDSLVRGVLQMFANRFTLAAAAYVYLLWLHWQLATLLVVVPLVIFLGSYWFSRWIEPKHLAVRERVGDLNARLNNNIDGISVIKAFGTEATERERVREASGAHLDAQWDAYRSQQTVEPVLRSVSQVARVLTLLVGGYWVIAGPPLFFTGALTVGALYTFYRFVGSLVTAMQGVTEVVDDYQNSKAAATRLQEIVRNDRIAERSGATPLRNPDATVTYEDVTFRYPGQDQPVLEDLSFEAAAGETVGIVGPTGAGKSTITALLLRFYDPDEGTVSLDGRDLRDVTIESLRESIGYVSQDPFLFYGTVRENIAYTEPDTPDSDVVEAARLAGAHEFISALPEGYDTQVGERGVKLSGGQRQRIAIARAIVRDPAILILDEATSHVDNETEVLIQRTLDRLAADRTTFLIAHRLSTVRDADTILVVDDGRIVERGTHESLLDNDGLYANLWRVQVGDVASLPDAFLERVSRGEST